LFQATFKFTSDAIGGDQFTVVSFTGRERVSELYRYEIEVKAPLSANIDLDDVLDGLVHFVTEQNGVEFPVNGILSSFEEFKTVQNYAHYKAVLVPRIWKLSNYKTNEIFYQAGDEGDIDAGLTITDIITQVLEKSGMTSADFDLGGLSSKLLKREYTCQYGESDFDFISRLLENEGVFYYFEQSATEEKIVFVNDLNYLSLPQPKLIFDVAAMANSQDNCVFGWSCRKQRLAERVVVRNYNPEEPSLDVSETTAIDSRGQGTEYIYGQNVQTDTEASYLSQVRAEEQICRKTQFFGESSVSRLQAGYLFLLEQHPNTKYNAIEYLAIEVNHEGHNLDMSIAHDANKQTRPQYQNSFVAISADVQYRPPLKTIKPRITGTLHAQIDGELLSEYAQLDSEGRYKVSMPFDFHNDDHPEGLASARVRMMQPYAGKGRGMQFPMAKGTEVLLTFVDGDPDRPLIAGAINTSAAPGPVTADNQTESVIQTGGNNKIRFEDEEGSERIIFESPKANSWLRIGTPNDPLGDLDGDGDPEIDYASDGIRINSGGSIWTEAVGKYGEYISGAPKNANHTVSVSAVSANTSATDMLANFNKIDSYNPRGLKARHGGASESLSDALDKAHIKVSSLDTFNTQEGNIYDFGGYWNYNLGNSYAENHMGQDQNVTLNSRAGHDLLDAGGPSWGTIQWPTHVGNNPRVEIDNNHSNNSGSDWDDKAGDLAKDVGEAITDGIDNVLGASKALSSLPSADTMLAGDYKNMWVDKSFGHSYDYKEGDSISVTKGSSLDVQHGGRHVEVSYRGTGSVSSWSHSDGGLSREKKWTGAGVLVLESSSRTTDSLILEDEKHYDRKTGIMYSSSNSQSTGMTGSSFEYSSAVTASASVNAGFTASTNTFIGGTASLSTYIGFKAEVEITVAGSVKVENTDVKLSFPGLSNYVKTNVVDVEANKMKNKLNDLENTANKLGTYMFKMDNTGSAMIYNTAGPTMLN
jgi:type VI secretion system VgrG family protein